MSAAQERALLVAKPYFDRLQRATDELRVVRDQMRPFWEYYFPRGWRAMARRLHLAPQPDYARYVTQLKQLHDTASRIVEDAKEAAEGLKGFKDAEPDIAKMGYFTYRQVYLDGSTVIMLYRVIEGMRSGDPDTLTYLAGLKELSDEVGTNLAAMRRTAATLAAHLG